MVFHQLRTWNCSNEHTSLNKRLPFKKTDTVRVSQWQWQWQLSVS